MMLLILDKNPAEAAVKVPKGMQGVPIALITAGILAMAFMGFANLV